MTSHTELVQYGLPIALSEAKLVLATAEREAVEHGWPVIIAVVDSAAELVLLERLDHAQFGSIALAISKARTAVRFKRPTKAFEDALARRMRRLHPPVRPLLQARHGADDPASGMRAAARLAAA